MDQKFIISTNKTVKHIVFILKLCSTTFDLFNHLKNIIPVYKISKKRKIKKNLIIFSFLFPKYNLNIKKNFICLYNSFINELNQNYNLELKLRLLLSNSNMQIFLNWYFLLF